MYQKSIQIVRSVNYVRFFNDLSSKRQRLYFRELVFSQFQKIVRIYIMEAKQVADVEQPGKGRQIKDQSRVSKENIFCETSIIDEQAKGMENFILQKYSQITDLQKYLVDQLQFIQQSKVKQTSINKLIGKKILPALKEVQHTVAIQKTLLQPFASMAASYVEAVASKCKDLLTQKEERYQHSQREIRMLKEQNQQLKSRLQAIDKRSIQSQKKENSVFNDRSSQGQKVHTLGKNTLKSIKIEDSTNNNAIIYPLKAKQVSKNNPYLLTSSPKAKRQRSPLNDLSTNQTIDEKTQGSSNFNKTINISYRCQRLITDNLSPRKSIEKLTPSKSTDKLVTPKGVENLTIFPSGNRKDYIKLKIQNLKQKNEAQFRQSYPRMK